MAEVQLIERVELSSSVWLTFWDLARKRQMSLEIARPTYDYVVGQLYRFDSRAKNEREALQPIIDQLELGRLTPLLNVARHPAANMTDMRSEVVATDGDRLRSDGILTTLQDRGGFRLVS